LLALPESIRDCAFLRGDRDSLGAPVAARRGVGRALRPAPSTKLCNRVLQDVRQPHADLTRSGREAIDPLEASTSRSAPPPTGRHVHWSSRADWYVHGDGLLVEE